MMLTETDERLFGLQMKLVKKKIKIISLGESSWNIVVILKNINKKPSKRQEIIISLSCQHYMLCLLTDPIQPDPGEHNNTVLTTSDFDTH